MQLNSVIQVHETVVSDRHHRQKSKINESADLKIRSVWHLFDKILRKACKRLSMAKNHLLGLT